MPSRVPRVTGESAIKAFAKAGFLLHHICGSHHILRHPEKPVRLTIPVHKGKTIRIGLLSSQIKAAGLTVEQFNDLL
jgi:predicted RNA binding protein YcfA (HicA-like mRNA interferase family)